MRKKAVTAAAAAGIAAFAIGAAAVTSNAPKKAQASSHREAPLISNDPTADLTDLYAFPSPGQTGRISLISNVIPIEVPAEGPNYYNLDDHARYRTMIDTNGDGKADKGFYLLTKTKQTNPETFLYTTGEVSSLHDPDLAVQQTWTLWFKNGTKKPEIVATGDTAPNNVGARSMPNYGNLASSAIVNGKYGIKVFVGPREDPFSIDVGRIFDLLSVGGPGTDNLKGVNVHTIAIEAPASLLRASAAQPVIGVWSAVDRKAATYVKVKRHGKTRKVRKIAWTQVERLGQPLINEVIIPRGDKDEWNTVGPDQDAQFEHYYTKPALVGALNQLVLKPVLQGALGGGYSDSLLAKTDGRADLAAILLRGFAVPGVLDLTFAPGDAPDTQPVDELRLNTNTAGTPAANVDRRGLLCNFASPAPFNAYDTAACTPGQLDGYPNGRRLGDDSTDIAIAALIGLPLPIVPADIQRPYAFLAMGGPNLPTTGALGLLHDGADGVPSNDANGGVFDNSFPYALPPNPGHS